MAVWQRRLKALKELGANSIRMAHNPDFDLVELCDRMGFLVMEESFDCWTVGKNPYDYHLYFRDWFKTDARDMVNAAVERAKAQVIIPILATTNMLNGDLAVSRNFINALGFTPGLSSFTNVNYDYTIAPGITEISPPSTSRSTPLI